MSRDRAPDIVVKGAACMGRRIKPYGIRQTPRNTLCRGVRSPYGV